MDIVKSLRLQDNNGSMSNCETVVVWISPSVFKIVLLLDVVARRGNWYD